MSAVIIVLYLAQCLAHCRAWLLLIVVTAPGSVVCWAGLLCASLCNSFIEIVLGAWNGHGGSILPWNWQMLPIGAFMKVFLKKHFTAWWLSIGQGDGTDQVVCNGSPLQYSCLENSMDGGAWRATVHGIAKELNTTEWLIHIRWNVKLILGACRLGFMVCILCYLN